MAKAKNHHFVPQGYLAAFTDTGTKDGQFNVMEVETGRHFRTSPRNVAATRDFNRVELDDRPVDALESALGQIESTLVDAVRMVLATRSFPDSDGCNKILNLIGLLAVRNPRRRDQFNAAREHTLNMIGDLLVDCNR